MFIMEPDIRKEILLFNGQSDLTYYELKTWRSAMYSMVTANKIYCEKMREAADLLFTFSELGPGNTTKGNYSQNAAVRISQILTKFHDFHKEMFGDLPKFTDPCGPFGDLIKSSDLGFGVLQKRSTEHLNEHVHCEKRVAKAWKYYIRRLKKLEKIAAKFSKTLSPEQMNKEYRFITAKLKLKYAVCRYNTCFENEVKHREVLSKQSVALEEEFLKEEKTKLDVMFTFINDALGRLEKLVPVGLNGNNELNFEPEVTRTKAMARAGWEQYLEKHTFPEGQLVCGPYTPKHTVVVCDMGKDENQDEDGDEDEYSDDEDSKNEDAEDEIVDVCTHQKVESLAAPKVNNTGMNDVLKEILDSLDNDIERSHTGRKSPESVREGSRDPSDESEKPKSQSSVIRRQRASSPVPRKRKPLRKSHRFRKCRPPVSTQEVGEEEACGRSHESRKYRVHNSSPNQRGESSREPSSQMVIEEVTDEETCSLSPRSKSWRKESLERGKDHEVSSRPKSQSQSEARSIRRRSSDRGKSTILQDFQNVVELALDVRREVGKEEACYSSQESKKDRVCVSSPSQRGQRSHKSKSRTVFEYMAERKSSCPTPRIKSSRKESLGRCKGDEVSQPHRETCSRRRQSVDGNKTTIVQDFHYIPPTRAKNQWVGPSPGYQAQNINVPQGNEKNEDKEATAAGSKTGSRSESRWRRRVAKEPNKGHNEKMITKDMPSKDSPRVGVAPGVRQTDVYVYALQDHEKQNPGEISITIGMKLKQLRFSETDGMAYGYKKTKFGLKKYGYYPASFVTLKNIDQG